MVQLIAPKEYFLLTDAQKDAICNGCGRKGLGGRLVPDTLWGLSITEACNIHDFMYAVGRVQADKEVADRVFLENMLRVIAGYKGFTSTLLRPFRRQRAREYYWVVANHGSEAFWQDKPKT